MGKLGHFNERQEMVIAITSLCLLFLGWLVKVATFDSCDKNLCTDSTLHPRDDLLDL